MNGLIEGIVAGIVDESKWLTVSMGFALLAVAVLLYRSRTSQLPVQRRVLAAMNLCSGVTIGTMAFGHLLAVTTKLVMGTLEGSMPLFYLIGLALAIPSWWLIYHTRRVLTSNDHGRRTIGLNVWLAVTLLALGLHNLPLATPSVLNVGYCMNSGRAMGWAITGVAILVNVGLFAGSLVFLATGQSFEQFQGIQ